MSFKIIRNDITKMNTEAIVNTANEDAAVGSGCDSAVYKAAGYDELLNYRKQNIGRAKEGEAFLTPGFNLPAKYIIHAVSPQFRDGKHGEERKLRACYRNSLLLAEKNNIKSIAFPLISSGSFGYPKEEAIRIAADEINAFLLKNDMEVFLVVFGDEAAGLGKKLYPDLEEYIDRNYVQVAAKAEYSICRSQSVSFEPEQCMPNASSRKNGNASACYDAFVDFFESHQRKLDERMSHLSDTYSQYLMYLIKEKNMENADVYKRAIVDKKIFSKIKNDKNYHPNKLTALCLCVGAKLNLDESKDLLARAGYALSPCDKTDIIFSYFIENEIYDMVELDIQLEEHGLPCIIT